MRYVLSVIVVVTCVVLAYRIASPNELPTVRINETLVSVEVADTPEARTHGLSGRTSLDPGSGMLFVFEKPDVYRFWMPDMRFPIDIIWIQDGIVVDITERVTNEFDALNPTYYLPSQPVQYVLEVSAGFTAQHRINVGDTVTFTL